MKRRTQHGFTLLELVIAVAIVAILAGVTAPALFRHVADAKISATRSELASLALALESYALAVGSYPTTQDGLDALAAAPPALTASWRGPYLKGGVPLDPWKNPYGYKMPGSTPGNEYDLYSTGRDGKLGGSGDDADLYQWRRESESVRLPSGPR